MAQKGVIQRYGEICCKFAVFLIGFDALYQLPIAE
jgi:hypothetical protein